MPGRGLEIVSGGGAGVEVIFRTGDDEEQRVPAIVGDVLPVVFDSFRVEWPDIGAVFPATRELAVRIWRANVIGRVNSSPTVATLGTARRLLTTISGTLAADDHAVLFDSFDELPARLDRTTNPGPSAGYMDDAVAWQLFLATVTADETPSASAPSIEIYAYQALTDLDVSRIMYVTASLSAVPATASNLAFSHFLNNSSSASGRIFAPPNGGQIVLYCPAANADGILYHGALYALGQS